MSNSRTGPTGPATWRINLKNVGGSCEVTGDFPPDGGRRRTAKYTATSTFLRDQQYEALKQRIGNGDRAAAQEVGETLFALLFGDQMGDAFAEWHSYAQRQNRVLRLLLNLGSLANEPWEYMYLEQLNFLSLNLHFSIVRYVEPNKAERLRPLVEAKDVHLLALVGDPPPGGANSPLNSSLELNALGNVFGEEPVKALRGGGLTLQALAEALARAPVNYQFIHFIGHSGDGKFLFRDSRSVDKEALVSAEDFALVLQSHTSLRLLTFTSCASFAAVSPLIHLQGVPAVVTMQSDMYDGPAATFTQTFYEALLKGKPIDTSVNEARRTLFTTFSSIGGYSTLWGNPTVVISSEDALHAVQLTSTGGELFKRPDREIPESISVTAESEDYGDGVKITNAHQNPVSALEFINGTGVPQGKTVLMSGGGDGTLRAWQLDRTRFFESEPASALVGSWTGHTNSIRALRAVQTQEGMSTLLSTSLDTSVRIWRWQDGVCLSHYETPNTAASALAMRPVKKQGLAVATESGRLYYLSDFEGLLRSVWAPSGAVTDPVRPLPLLPPPLELGGVAEAVTFSVDGMWLAAASRRAIVPIWISKSGDDLAASASLRHDADQSIVGVAALSSTHLLTAATSGKMHLWQVMPRTELVKSISLPQAGVKGVIRLGSKDLFLVFSASWVSLHTGHGTSFGVEIWRRELGPIASVAAFDDNEGTVVAVGLQSGSIVVYRTRLAGD